MISKTSNGAGPAAPQGAAERHPVMAALLATDLDAFEAVESFTGAAIRLVGNDADGGRLMVARTDPNGSARSEWRSHAWVERALTDGHWAIVPHGPGAALDAASASSAAAARAM